MTASNQVIIREARPADAARLIAFVQRIAEEPDADIALAPGEFTITVEQEEKIVADYAASANSVFLVAVAGQDIIGVLTCKGGSRQANRHAATLGISVAREWRDQGIGTRLMANAIEWAKASGVVTRIELFVFARNARAIHVYENAGFEVEGRRRNALRRNGAYIDDLLMALVW